MKSDYKVESVTPLYIHARSVRRHAGGGGGNEYVDDDADEVHVSKTDNNFLVVGVAKRQQSQQCQDSVYHIHQHLQRTVVSDNEGFQP